MVILRWFSNLRIRYKLFLTYCAVLLVTVGVGTLVLDSYVQQSITQDAESDLTNSAELVINIVKTAANVSVKNHLRATAENNREIVRYYYEQFVAGRLSEQEAKAAAGEVLLSQRVGKTGYLFVWDIRNAPESIPLAVHPKIQGQDVSDVDFVQKGARLKNGYLEYRWRNPGEKADREKAMYLAYFEPWQWIVAASSYKEEFKELVNVGDFRDSILSIRLGRTGYFFVIDSSGNVVIHPALEGNYFDATDSHGRFFIREICSMKRGQLSYSWKNPGEANYRQKLASFGYIPEYDWIVAASGYKDEFEAPLQGIRSIALLTTGMSVLLILVISFVIGSIINRPMQKLVDAFEQDATDLGIRLPVKSLDEIGRLSLHFNRFMDRLELESTERSAAERALREREEQYRILAENVSDVIFTMTLDMKLTYISPSAERMYGWTVREWHLLKPTDYLPPPSLDLALKTLSEELAFHGTRGVDSNRARILEIEQYRKDGSTFWTEVSMRLLRDPEGAPCGIIGAARDVTERKRSEAARTLLASAVEQAEENILVTDHLRTIIYINPAFERSSGYRLEELQGQKLRVLRSAHHDEAFYQDMKDTLDRGEVWMGIIINKAKDGGDFEIEGSISPLRDASEAVTHFVGAGRNMSRVRKLEKELNQAQKMESIGRLAGGVAHDFNNMLGVILGHAELALGITDSNQPAFKDLQEIVKASHRSAALVRQLLAFARKQTVRPKVLDINETVESMLKMVRRLIGEDVELLWKPSVGVWPVKVDPTQIDQILANLCVNARDAIAGVGKVVIETRNVLLDRAFCREYAGSSEGDYVLLAVSDTGCGMGKDVLEKLFEPFFTTKEVGKGTGLGLATVYGIVRQNNGFIEVQSKPGQGTTFRIYLPRTDSPTAEEQPSQPQEAILQGTETILLVEDEESILELGRRTLDRYGYQVLTARNPTEALDLAKRHPSRIDLLITDVIMPGMNGKELAERLTVIRPGFRSIYMSGYTDDVIAQHGVLEEGVHFLQKPFAIQSLAAKIREVLDS